MNQGTCETCRWRHIYATNPEKSECRLNPPTPLSDAEGGHSQSIFPDVRPSDWCSHYTPKPLPATGEKGEGIVPKWPLMRYLPENEQGPFEKWLTGQTRPLIMDGDKIAEGNQDAYYPWDYDRWKAGLPIID